MTIRLSVEYPVSINLNSYSFTNWKFTPFAFLFIKNSPDMAYWYGTGIYCACWKLKGFHKKPLQDIVFFQAQILPNWTSLCIGSWTEAF